MRDRLNVVLVPIIALGLGLVLLLWASGAPASRAAGADPMREVVAELASSVEAQPAVSLSAADPTTVTMVMVPSGDAKDTARAAEEVAALLEQETGHNVYAFVAGCYGAAIDALGSGEADVGWLPANAYVLAHEQYAVEVKLVTVRYGSTFYRGQFLVREDSGIDELGDLQDKSFAFGDPLSSSSFMYPAVHISRTQGMTYAAFFSETVFAGSHSAVVAAVYNGEYDATLIQGGATYEDARNGVVGDHPDVFTETKVIAYTDPVPNDTVSVRAGLEAGLVQDVISGLLTIADSPEGQDALNRLSGIGGLQPVADSAYDVVREVVTAYGLEYESCSEAVDVAPGSDGTLIYAPGNQLTATIQIPADGVTQPVQVTYDPIPAVTYPPPGLGDTLLAFGLRAVVSGTDEGINPLLAPYTITVDYVESGLSTIREESLALHYWDGSRWRVELSSTVDTAGNTVSAGATQLRRWALLGEGGVTMVVVPIGDAEANARAAEQIAELLEREVGSEVYALVAGCEGAAIEALASGEADVGWLGAAAYVLAHDRFGIEVRLVGSRFGSTTYRGQFLVREDSGINDLADLAGKNFAFSDPTSTSSFLFPATQISRTQGITYAAFFNQTVFVGSHDGVVVSVIEGEHAGTAIHGGACYDDARHRVIEDYPDVFTETKVITYTDYIPNDTVSVRAGLEEHVSQAVVDGLRSLADTEEGQEVLRNLYGMDGVEPIDDSPYDVVREMVTAFELDYQTCSERAGITPEAGGILTSTNGVTTTVQVPGEAVSQAIQLRYTSMSALTYPPEDLSETGYSFALSAVVSGTAESVTSLDAPYTLTVSYDLGGLNGVAEGSLGLFHWDGAEWVPEPTSAVDVHRKIVWATPDHFSLWAVLGERLVYLPLVLRGSE